MPAKTLCHYKWVQASCIRCSYCTDHTHLLLSLSPGFLEMTSTSLCPPYLSLTSLHSFSWPSHLHFSFHHVQLYFSPSEFLSFPQCLKSSMFVNIMLKNNNNKIKKKKKDHTHQNFSEVLCMVLGVAGKLSYAWCMNVQRNTRTTKAQCCGPPLLISLLWLPLVPFLLLHRAMEAVAWTLTASSSGALVQSLWG